MLELARLIVKGMGVAHPLSSAFDSTASIIALLNTFYKCDTMEL
jgi:hypothetical protein